MSEEIQKKPPIDDIMFTLAGEHGPIHVNVPMLIELLHDTYAMATATAVEYYDMSHNDRKTVRLVNNILNTTWGNPTWCAKFVKHMFVVLEEEQKKQQEVK